MARTNLDTTLDTIKDLADVFLLSAGEGIFTKGQLYTAQQIAYLPAIQKHYRLVSVLNRLVYESNCPHLAGQLFAIERDSRIRKGKEQYISIEQVEQLINTTDGENCANYHSTN